MPAHESLTIAELNLAYHRHASDYYRDAPIERKQIRLALKPLRRLYGATAATGFRPLALRAVREEMLKKQSRVYRRSVVENGKRKVTQWSRENRLSRQTVNMRVDIIRRVFKWAVAQELVPSEVYEGSPCETLLEPEFDEESSERAFAASVVVAKRLHFQWFSHYLLRS